MNNVIISKDDFVAAIQDLKKMDEYHDGLNKFFRTHNVDGYIYQPDCAVTVLNLLHLIFGEADADNWIAYYCLELLYGKKYKQGDVVDENGNEIDLSSDENLYNFLIGRL